MEENLTYNFTWEQFAQLIVALLAIYWFFKLIKKGLESIHIFSEFRNVALIILHKFLTIFQPLAFIISLSVFVFINPVLHGVIMGLVLIFSFLHLKNYLSGRIVLLDGSIVPGKQITYNSTRGSITRCGHLGIQVMTKTGITHISYSNLLTKGYTITPTEPASAPCKLQVRADGEKQPSENLKDLLNQSPYIDTQYPLKIEQSETHSTVNCHLFFQNNLSELIETLQEAGYNVQRA